MKTISILAALGILAIGGSVAGPANLQGIVALAPAAGQSPFVAVGQNSGAGQIQATSGTLGLSALGPTARVPKPLLRGPATSGTKEAALPGRENPSQDGGNPIPPNPWIRLLKELIRG